MEVPIFLLLVMGLTVVVIGIGGALYMAFNSRERRIARQFRKEAKWRAEKARKLADKGENK